MHATLALLVPLCAAATARADEDDKHTHASKIYDHGLALVKERRFLDAIKEFETAHRISNASVCVHALAEAFTELASIEPDPDKAHSYRKRALYEWRVYFLEDPNYKDRAQANEKVAALEREVARYEEQMRARDTERERARQKEAESAALRLQVDQLETQRRAQKAAHVKQLATVRKDGRESAQTLERRLGDAERRAEEMKSQLQTEREQHAREKAEMERRHDEERAQHQRDDDRKGNRLNNNQKIGVSLMLPGATVLVASASLLGAGAVNYSREVPQARDAATFFLTAIPLTAIASGLITAGVIIWWR